MTYNPNMQTVVYTSTGFEYGEFLPLLQRFYNFSIQVNMKKKLKCSKKINDTVSVASRHDKLSLEKWNYLSLTYFNRRHHQNKEN